MTHLQLSPRRAILIAALLACLVAQKPLPSFAQGVSPDGAMRDFQRISDYVLLVNGKEVPAEIYHSQRAAALLVIASALPSPVLLSPATSSAETVNLMKIDKKPDGTIDLLAGAPLAPQGTIEFEAEEVHFKADGRSATLKPAPPLLGLRRSDEVTAHNPEYLPRAAAYAPNPQAVAALKQERRPVTVRIFYGSWCPHCREMVPHAIKLEQTLKGAGSVHFEYFGLPPNFGKELAARQNAISAVPTGIVYVNGKEAGRIVGLSWSSPESSLVSILNPVKG